MSIEFNRGNSFPVIHTVKDKKTKNPLPLQGDTLKLYVFPNADPVNDDEALFVLDGTITDPQNGVVRFLPTPENNAKRMNAFYEIRLTTDEGYIITVKKDSYSVV